MIMNLAEYDKYFKDGDDGKIIVIKKTPSNIITKLKKLNNDYKKANGENLFEFEE